MIPKKIHYCWYSGRSIPSKYARCIESWHEHLPGYEIVEWSEKNTEIDTPFLKDAMVKERWAFLSDYIRMRAIYSEGGVYLDADTEIIKAIDPLLQNSCFIGYEARNRPTSGVIGSVRGHDFPAACMKIIDARFEQKLPYLIAPEVTALALNRATAGAVKIYEPRYFYPYNPYDPDRPSSGLMYRDITEDTYAVHHWAKGWSSENMNSIEVRARRFVKKLFSNIKK